MRGRSASPPPSPYARALARLARRDHSEQEVRRALLRDGYAEDEIEATVARLRRERYLDDTGYAERFARSRMKHQGLGTRRVHQGLRAKGVDAKTAEAGLKAARAEVSESAVLDDQARRYWRTHTKDEPADRVRKLWAFLVRRGFPPALVHDRLRALWPRWRDALEGLEPVEE